MEKDLKNAVIEIQEVEYLITKEASDQIDMKKESIDLRRLIDHKNMSFPLKIIIEAIKSDGIVDNL